MCWVSDVISAGAWMWLSGGWGGGVWLVQWKRCGTGCCSSSSIARWAAEVEYRVLACLGGTLWALVWKQEREADSLASSSQTISVLFEAPFIPHCLLVEGEALTSSRCYSSQETEPCSVCWYCCCPRCWTMLAEVHCLWGAVLSLLMKARHHNT